MVLIIVMRHIDLSVGSILGFVSAIIGVAQVYCLSPSISASTTRPSGSSPSSSRSASARRSARFNGFLVAYPGIPAFIVTLGGQLFWSGAAWWVIDAAQTVAPLDERFALIGGGPQGSIGATASWALGAVACVGIVSASSPAARRARFQFPAAADVGGVLIAVVGCVVVARRDLVVNAYPWPERVAAKYAADNNIPCRRAACTFRPASPFPC